MPARKALKTLTIQHFVYLFFLNKKNGQNPGQAAI
jgi:hypothetical protein